MSAQRNRKKEYFDGVKSALPVILGFVPVGIAYAVMAHDAGFSVLETVMMSLLVFAGASQMMAVGMYAQGAGLVAIITAAFIINLRHVIMSTCVFNRMGNTPLALRIISSAGVTDETFAIFTTSDEKRCTPAFFLGLVSVAYLSWAAGSLIGALASGALPPLVSASLGIAMHAMFIGLLVPRKTCPACCDYSLCEHRTVTGDDIKLGPDSFHPCMCICRGVLCRPRGG